MATYSGVGIVVQMAQLRRRSFSNLFHPFSRRGARLLREARRG